jgi:hypothetical protein
MVGVLLFRVPKMISRNLFCSTIPRSYLTHSYRLSRHSRHSCMFRLFFVSRVSLSVYIVSPSSSSSAFCRQSARLTALLARKDVMHREHAEVMETLQTQLRALDPMSQNARVRVLMQLRLVSGSLSIFSTWLHSSLWCFTFQFI